MQLLNMHKILFTTVLISWYGVYVVTSCVLSNMELCSISALILFTNSLCLFLEKEGFHLVPIP